MLAACVRVGLEFLQHYCIEYYWILLNTIEYYSPTKSSSVPLHHLSGALLLPSAHSSIGLQKAPVFDPPPKRVANPRPPAWLVEHPTSPNQKVGFWAPDIAGAYRPIVTEGDVGAVVPSLSHPPLDPPHPPPLGLVVAAGWAAETRGGGPAYSPVPDPS